MNYRTTCPHCVSVFRLGNDQLDAAQGWVQCSVCGAAFDARISLLMEDGSPLPPVEPEIIEVPQPPATDAETAEAALHETGPAPAAHDLPGKAVIETAAPAEEPRPVESPRGIIEREDPLDLPSIILLDPNSIVPDETGSSLPAYDTSAYPNPPAIPAPPAAGDTPASPFPAARIEYATPLPGSARIRRTPRRINRWGWAIASVLLLGVLAAQSAYFLRDTLVSRLPQTRPAFEQICAATGCSLSLPKNLALLKIIGSDLQTEAPARGASAGAPPLRSDPSAAGGRLRLTLTLGNQAHHVQAWPVLVLTLTDQRNRPLARRSFAPSEYLEDTRRIATGIPPRSEQSLILPLTVRDLAPMGFDLKLTY